MRPILLVAAAVSVVGCGAGVRDAVQYRGDEQSAIAGPSEVREVSAMPPGHEKIGQVLSVCFLQEKQRHIDGAYLSDVDCSTERLLRAMKERTAAVGGDVLVDVKCGSRLVKQEGPRKTRVRCKAVVGRPGNAALWRAGARGEDPAALTDDPALPSASDAWNIRVHFTSAIGGGPRSPRRRDLVAEVGAMPVSHVALGDVVTRCKEGCSQEATREGVREVAGRVGAHSVVDIRCAERKQGWMCTGTAAGYEVDPTTDPRAR